MFNFGPVWFVTEAKLKSVIKWSEVDDTGELDVASGGLHFQGRKKGAQVFPNVRRVALVGPFVPWGTVAVMAVTVALILLLTWAGMFQVLTLDSPQTYVLLVLIVLLALWATPWTWVEVEYLGENGQPQRAYFADGTVHGRLLATGIKQLYERLKHLGKEHS